MYIYIYIYKYICMCIYMYVCVYYIYICMYIYFNICLYLFSFINCMKYILLGKTSKIIFYILFVTSFTNLFCINWFILCNTALILLEFALVANSAFAL